MIAMSCKGQTAVTTVRPATQAGLFYESNPQLLSREVDSLLLMHNSQCTIHNNVAALIVPHAGYYYSVRRWGM